MLGGIGIGLLSGAKNKKIMIIVGAVLIAIGIGGLVSVGSQAVNLAVSGDLGGDAGRSYFYTEYAFMFTLFAGFVLTIFVLVRIQGEKCKRFQHS